MRRKTAPPTKNSEKPRQINDNFTSFEYVSHPNGFATGPDMVKGNHGITADGQKRALRV
jgi:hypothetical protein